MPALLLLAAVTGCESDVLYEFQLDGDTLALAFIGDGAVAAKAALCIIPEASYVGTKDYPAQAQCRRREVQVELGGWTIVPEGIVSSFTSSTSAGAACGGACRRVVLFDRGSSAAVNLLAPGPLGPFVLSADWVVWADRGADANGRCFSPEDDEDCVVDLYALDRREDRIVRLTGHAGVYPDSGALGSQSLDIGGDKVVYIDRRGTPDRCVGVGLPVEDEDGCDTEVRVIDLATGEDRPVSTDGGFKAMPRISGDFVAWAAGDDLRTLRPRVKALGAEVPRILSSTLDPGSRLDFQDDWIVWQHRARIWAYNVESGLERPVSDADEVALDPMTSRGRVAWRDDGGAITLYDLTTNRRRLIADVSVQLR